MEWLQKLIKKPSSDKPRIHAIDELRGLAVCDMVFYHFLYTFSSIFGMGWSTALFRFFQPHQPFLAGTFILLAGISANLSRSNVKRGLKLAVVAVAISVITILFMPAEAIWFGVLHLLSAAMILTGLILPALNRLPVWPSIILCGAIVLFTANISRGYLGFFGWEIVPMPGFFYQTDWLMWLGTYSPTFFSADYFPLLPWLFVFLGGVFFGRYAKDGRFPKWTYKRHVPFLSFVGRHALLIYIVHQPLFYGVGLLLSPLFR